MVSDSSNPYIIHVPHQNLADGGADMRSRLQTWKWRRSIPAKFNGLCLDLTSTHFIEPWALALYTAYALSVAREKGIAAFAKLDPGNPSNLYVEQMGLPHVLDTGKSTTDWDSSEQNTGLHVIWDHHDVRRFVNSLSNLQLGIHTDLIDALEYCMAEIARNVVQHSHSKIGGVAIGQYFPDRNAIQISVADCGHGVKNALKAMYPEVKSDQEALKLAVLPHVSGAFDRSSYSGSDNAGLGLFFTKEICWRSGGSFWLASGDAVMGIRNNDETARNRIHRRIEPWLGASVTLDIPEAGVTNFGNTLTICRTLADQARKCSGVAGLDFLDADPDLENLTSLEIGPIREDVEAAATLRDETIIPAMKSGEMLILDFGGARFVTQSFVHALLHDAFTIPGSLLRLSFINCSSSSEEAIRTVAAYAASYDICVNRRKVNPRDGSL